MERARRWFLAAWLSLGVLVAAAAGLSARGVATCDAQLFAVAEPEGWREWPLMVDNDATSGLCPQDASQLLSFRQERRTPSGWFRSRPGSEDLVVATPADGTSLPDDERFLAAYRRVAGRHVRWTTQRAAASALAAALGALALAFALGLAHVRLRRALGLRAAENAAHFAVASSSGEYRRAAAGAVVKAIRLTPAEAEPVIRVLRRTILALALLVAVAILGAAALVGQAWSAAVL
jgi:hypothetical protein